MRRTPLSRARIPSFLSCRGRRHRDDGRRDHRDDSSVGFGRGLPDTTFRPTSTTAQSSSTTQGGSSSTTTTQPAPTFADTTAANGTTYYYVVSAVNIIGEGAESGEASATPEEPLAAPDAPTGLNATAGDGEVALTWNVSPLASSYKVKRSTTGGGSYTTISTPTDTSFTDTTAVNGTTYYYVVSGVNATGESPDSSEVIATPIDPVPPATPTGLVAVAGNAQVSLSWNAPATASSYRVKRSTTQGSGYATIASPTGNTYEDTTVVNGTTYYYVVSAVNAFGESGNSSDASATPEETAAGTPIGGGTGVGITATASAVNDNNFTDFGPEQTINGSGLNLETGEHSSGVRLGWLHPGTTSQSTVENAWIQWDLGASYTLDRINVWNNNQANQGNYVTVADVYVSNVADPGDPEGA